MVARANIWKKVDLNEHLSNEAAFSRGMNNVSVFLPAYVQSVFLKSNDVTKSMKI